MGQAPGYIDKVNTVVKFVENPCNAPWTVYFESALISAGRQILVLLSFGLDDIIRGYFRPKGIYQARRSPFGRRGKGKHRKGVIIPEIGEMIGKRLPGAEEARGRTVTQGVKTMWLIDGVLQRALWYWLVVDVTIDFFYTWATLVQKSTFCQAENQGKALRTGSSSPMLGLAGWQGVLAPTAVYAEGPVVTAIGSFFFSAGIWEVTVAATFQNPSDVTMMVELALSRNPVDPEGGATSGRISVGPRSSGDLVAHATVSQIGFIYMIGFLDTLFGSMDGVIFSCLEILPDPEAQP